MWDLLEMLLNFILEIPWDPVLADDFWRFSLCFFASLILAGVIELASSQSKPFRATSIVLLGALAGGYWEWRSRRRE
jgi:hypothetical protein